MDKFIVDHFIEISNGAKSEHARPKYASDGEEANSFYETDVFIKFDLQKGELPISSLRPVYVKKAIEEVCAIYQDQQHDLETFEKRGVNWWADWSLDERGFLGNAYGDTVRKYGLIDKILDGLEKNPYNRRNILNLWQMEQVNINKGLQPCAFQVMFDVRKINGKMLLDMSLTQRSSDAPVAGMGINQMQYVALQMMVAKHFGWEVGTFSWHVMNFHLYDRNLVPAQEIVDRYYSPGYDSSDEIEFYLDEEDKTNFYDIKSSNFVLKGYKGMKPQIEFDLAV